MKNLFVFLGLLFSMISSQFATAQNLDEIINKHIDAIGGKEKLMALNSVKFEGSLNTQGVDIGVVVTVLHGKGARTDIAVPGMSEGFRVITPNKGWVFLPFQGMSETTEMPDDQVQLGQAQLDLQSSLLDYKAKGHQVELLGKENIDGGVTCFKLKITYKNGKIAYLFINATTFLKVKSVTTTNINGEDMELETTYDDFKKLPEGYVFPYSQTNQSGTITFSSIIINKPVDEKIFKVN